MNETVNSSHSLQLEMSQSSSYLESAVEAKVHSDRRRSGSTINNTAALVFSAVILLSPGTNEIARQFSPFEQMQNGSNSDFRGATRVRSLTLAQARARSIDILESASRNAIQERMAEAARMPLFLDESDS